MSEARNLLVLPHLRIQNANAISSPLTWGFPAMSAFIGWMQALERKLPEHIDLEFHGVGVICHHHQAQTSKDFVHRFNLTRNPIGKDGKTAAIVEEGRIHLELTLVLAVEGNACLDDADTREQTARDVVEIASGMRIAGGSVLQNETGWKPELIALSEVESEDPFRRLRRSWLPGFALVLRDDLLHRHHAELQADAPATTLLDAWLDLSRLNIECHQQQSEDANGNPQAEVLWETRRSPGWIVPLPVGYGALSPLQEAGSVRAARDPHTPFRFVESLYSIGQWISPHRLTSADQLIWYVDNTLENGLYRLNNDYSPATAAQA